MKLIALGNRAAVYPPPVKIYGYGLDSPQYRRKSLYYSLAFKLAFNFRNTINVFGFHSNYCDFYLHFIKIPECFSFFCIFYWGLTGCNGLVLLLVVLGGNIWYVRVESGSATCKAQVLQTCCITTLVQIL